MMAKETPLPTLWKNLTPTSQKKWWATHRKGQPFPKNDEGDEGPSAAAAKKVKVQPRKMIDVKPDSIRAINAAKQQAYMAKGGRQPIGAMGSGGSNVMAGAGHATIKDLKASIKAGFNPKVSLNPYEGMTKKEKQQMKKEEVQIEAANPNKMKKNEYIRQLGLKAMKAGKVDPARGHSPTRFGREVLKKEEADKTKKTPSDTSDFRERSERLKSLKSIIARQEKEDRLSKLATGEKAGRWAFGGKYEQVEAEQMNEVTKKEAEALLGGPIKEKPKMPPGKQPAGYRYVRGLARKAMKAGMKKEEVEQTDEAAYMGKGNHRPGWMLKADPKLSAKVKAAKNMNRLMNKYGGKTGEEIAKMKKEEVEQTDEARKPDASMAMTNQLRMKAITTKDKQTLGKVADLMAAQKKLDKKNMKEDTEMKYIEEKLSASDPASKWISDFVKSDNPKFAGKSKKERIQQALGAYYAAKRGTNEESEQIHELKKSTLASYVNKSAGDIADRARAAGISHGLRDAGVLDDEEDDVEGDEENERKMQKRTSGIKKASAKLAKEESEQIDEGATHWEYTGTVNNKDWSLTIPRGDDLTDHLNHRKIMRQNPHLEPHEAKAVRDTSGEDGPVEVEHKGKKYTHHVTNDQEPKMVYGEEVELDEAAADWEKAFNKVAKKNLNKDVGPLKAKVKRMQDVGKEPTVSQKVTAKQTGVDEEVESVDEVTGYEGVKDRKDTIKRAAAMNRMGKDVFLSRVKARAIEMKREKAKKALAKEEVGGKTPETATEVELAKKHGNPKKITYGDVIKARIASAKKKVMEKGE
jgi:hypothetical protein